MSTNQNSERRARAHDAHTRWQARHEARTIRYVIRHIPVGAMGGIEIEPDRIECDTRETLTTCVVALAEAILLAQRGAFRHVTRWRVTWRGHTIKTCRLLENAMTYAARAYADPGTVTIPDYVPRLHADVSVANVWLGAADKISWALTRASVEARTKNETKEK